MAEIEANGIRLHCEQSGEGEPILCIHGTGSSAAVWGDAVAELSRHGRVIAYDRRGHARSELPEPYETTSVEEHGADAAAVLEAVDAGPAVVIGRSYGGPVALSLALRNPERVRALVLLEPVEVELVPAVADWARELGAHCARVAEERGFDAVGEAMLTEVLGEGTWETLPAEIRELFSSNGRAIVAEQQGRYLEATGGELRELTQPTLLVVAADSPDLLREVPLALGTVLPDARAIEVEGGHLIDPSHPAVLAFVDEVLGSG
jgi:esterase